MADDELYEDSEELVEENHELDNLLSKRAPKKVVDVSTRRSIDDYFERKRLQRQLDDELLGDFNEDDEMNK